MNEYVRQKNYRDLCLKYSEFINSDYPRHTIITGGRNTSKSAIGTIKAIERFKKGCTGAIMGSSRSALDLIVRREFEKWYGLRIASASMFSSAVLNNPGIGGVNAQIYFMEAQDLNHVLGTNLNFVFMDEPNFDNQEAFQIMEDRCRIRGPNMELPQIWMAKENFPRAYESNYRWAKKIWPSAEVIDLERPRVWMSTK